MRTRPGKAAEGSLAVWLGIGLLLLTLSLFWPAAGFEILSFDDGQYLDTSHARNGFTWEGLRTAFTRYLGDHWVPLLRISFMLDGEVFGPSPVGFHLTNVFLHAANTFLVFFLMRRMTGRPVVSAISAAVFAVHPLRVEPVVWVAGRKDLLSTFMFLLALTAWIQYTRTRKMGWYAAAAAGFALSLMAKTLLMTFPFLLLALDLWPLGRWKARAYGDGALRGFPLPLVFEKIPLFLIGAAFGLFAFTSQTDPVFPGPVNAASILANLGRAAASYLVYLRDMVWPSMLGPRFRDLHPTPPVPWHMAALVFLPLLVLLVAAARRRYPALAAAGLWYFAYLLPVSGVFLVGAQWTADRYTYVPDILLISGIAWTVDSSLKDHRWRRLALGLCIVLVAALSVTTRHQMGFWRTPEAFARRAMQLGPENPYALSYLASVLFDAGKPEQALEIHRLLVREYPNEADLRYNHAMLLVETRRFDEALQEMREVLRHDPAHALTLMRLGRHAFTNGDFEAAFQYYSKLVVARPSYVGAPHAHHRLALILERWGQPGIAMEHFRQAVAGAPLRALYRFNLAVVLADMGNMDEAILQFRETLRLDPDDHRARINLAEILAERGDADGAAVLWRQLSDAVPGTAEYFFAQGRLAQLDGDNQAARTAFGKGLTARPIFPEMIAALKADLADLDRLAGASGTRRPQQVRTSKRALN